MAKLLASWIAAGYLLFNGRWSHLRVTQALMDVWQAAKQATAKSLGYFQHQYLAKLLVNMYSYCLMVKSVFYFCVRGKSLFSNPVTFKLCKIIDYQSYNYKACPNQDGHTLVRINSKSNIFQSSSPTILKNSLSFNSPTLTETELSNRLKITTKEP